MEKILREGKHYACSENLKGVVVKMGFSTKELAQHWTTLLRKDNYKRIWVE